MVRNSSIPSKTSKPDGELPGEKSITKPDEPEEDNRYENMVYGRLNIGARNPVVLAINKLESMDYTVPPGPYSGEDIRKLLEKAFGTSDKTPVYETLFDPANGSPVYYGIYDATARLVECPYGAQLYGEALGVLSEDPARRTGAGGPPPECPYRTKSQNQSGTINGLPVKYRDETAGLTNKGIEFNDPVQGCVADCWLIAALSSVALIELIGGWGVKKIVVDPPVTPPIKVFPPSKWPNPYYITTTDEYYTTANQTKPYFGGLNPIKPPSPAHIYESWAAFYEKCFAGYYQLLRIPPFVQNNNPDYSKLNFKGTFGALSDITGKIVSTTTQAETKTYLGGAGAADRDGEMIERIRTGACKSGALNEGFVTYTKYPAVAYTYVSQSYVPADANLPGKGYNPNPVAYNCTGMPANHAFSLIGLFLKNDNKYVVLRNPWGIAGDNASFNAGLQASLAPGLVFPEPYHTLNLGAEGIFGLSSVNFMRYFEAFGWTFGFK